MNKLTIVLASLLVASLVSIKPVMANDNCSNQYGQYGQYVNCTPSQSILMDKYVGRVTLNKGAYADIEYVDNMSASDNRFHANDMVAFKLRVKNTSNVAQTNVTVKDFLPSYVTAVEGPGSYDATNRVVSFNAGDFQPNEEKVYYLKVQVVAASNMPSDKGLFCVDNKAQAYNGSVSDEDTAQFCIEKQVTNVVKVPSAGPEMGVLLLTGEIFALGAGLLLKKRISG